MERVTSSGSIEHGSDLVDGDLIFRNDDEVADEPSERGVPRQSASELQQCFVRLDLDRVVDRFVVDLGAVERNEAFTREGNFEVGASCFEDCLEKLVREREE